MIADIVLPVALPSRLDGVCLRRAVPEDLEELMRLLADDAISGSRGDLAQDGDTELYRDALTHITADPGNDLIVGVDAQGRIIATLQLTRIPGMARRGSTRLLVEAVRVSSDLRSSGVGTALMRWVMEVVAPTLGASLVQLTSDNQRRQAHRFYQKLGFTPSHLGFKYAVPPQG